MNRRGFFAALASLPFVPKALAAPRDIRRKVSQTLGLANFQRALRSLKRAPQAEAVYLATVNALNRRIDQHILKELSK